MRRGRLGEVGGMSSATTIEWTEVTWNPTTGCDRISPGCDHCYALTLARRLNAMGSAKYQRDGDPRTSGPGFGLTIHQAAVIEPLRWRAPRRVFVNSMSDLSGGVESGLASHGALFSLVKPVLGSVLHARQVSRTRTPAWGVSR
jgi:Protein of unknown function (DUF5131)